MGYVPPGLLEEAVAFKVRLGLHDFLGIAEDNSPYSDVQVGGTSRPQEYVQAADILNVGVVQTPAVAVGIRSIGEFKRQGTQRVADCLVDVAARFGCSTPSTTFDVGFGPRLYLEALLNLFEQPWARDLGGGVRLGEPPVVEAVIGDPQRSRNGDQFALAVITLSVPAVPLSDTTPVFDGPPSSIPDPSNPPRTPDTPLTILDLITSVEAMP